MIITHLLVLRNLLKMRINVYLLILFCSSSYFSQKKIEHNIKIGLDFNLIAYGANDATVDPLPKSLNIGYIYSKYNSIKNTRFEFGAQIITYGSQFKWIYYGSHGLGQPEEVLVRFRYTVLNFPALIGVQKKNQYASIGPGISCPFYYIEPHSSAIYQPDGKYRLFVPFVSLMLNCGSQFVLFDHKFSLEVQSSLFHYSTSASFKNTYVGYLNAGIALKYNLIKEKSKLN